MKKISDNALAVTKAELIDCNLTEGAVLAFLRSPDSKIVDLAIQMANLTWKEELAITHCGRRDETQDVAAEKTGYSVDSVQRWYRAGITKLRAAWSGVWWIHKLTQ
jgi:hypothetical protein